MLKVVVFDGGYGGELFADLLEENLPVVEVIRVIDWRNAKALTCHARTAREAAETALQPYIGKVDLIVLANVLLTMTGLRYFRRKYPDQKFLGLPLELPNRPSHDVLILTTHAVARSLGYYMYTRHLHNHVHALVLDDWPAKIDDGELYGPEISQTLEDAGVSRRRSWDIVLGCTQFRDIRGALDGYFIGNIKTFDGFDDCLRAVCHALKIRGGIGRKK